MIQTAAVPSLTYATGDSFALVVEVVGSGTTQLRAKLWKTGAAAPASWQLSASDTSADLQVAGAVGLRASRPSSATSTAVIAFDDFEVIPVG